jgi:hypothetical protein
MMMDVLPVLVEETTEVLEEGLIVEAGEVMKKKKKLQYRRYKMNCSSYHPTSLTTFYQWQ